MTTKKKVGRKPKASVKRKGARKRRRRPPLTAAQRAQLNLDREIMSATDKVFIESVLRAYPNSIQAAQHVVHGLTQVTASPGEALIAAVLAAAALRAHIAKCRPDWLEATTLVLERLFYDTKLELLFVEKNPGGDATAAPPTESGKLWN
jgi:hypothetical protein